MSSVPSWFRDWFKPLPREEEEEEEVVASRPSYASTAGWRVTFVLGCWFPGAVHPAAAGAGAGGRQGGTAQRQGCREPLA